MAKVDERAVVPALDAPARRRLSVVLDREGVVAASLIGSQATESAQPLSDIDIGVWLAPALSPRQRFEMVLEIGAAATGALGTNEIDVVALNDAPPLLRHRALRDGRRLIERDPVTRVRLETRALLDYLDTAPLRSQQEAARRARLTEGRFGRR